MLNYYKKIFLIIAVFIIFIISTKFILGESNLKMDSQYVFIYLSSFFPPEHSTEFVIELLKNSFLTIWIATLSVLVATVFSIPIAIYTSNKFSESLLFKRKMDYESNFLRKLSRTTLIFIRSIPELILAIFFVRIFGLGFTSAVLSIIIIYTGLLSKVFIEIIDSDNSDLLAKNLYSGHGKLKSFFYITLTKSSNDFISYLIFRWECAIRTSIVIGIVGAGGIGQQLFFAMQTMELKKVSSIIICLIIIIMISDICSVKLRERFAKSK